MAKRIYADPQMDLEHIFQQAEAGDIIELQPGVYRQKLLLTNGGVTLQGAGADQTILEWDDYALKIDEQGREYNTFRTYTLAVCADNVIIRDLAIVNSALNPKEKGQEVALSVLGDDFLMENCRLSSTQDTLFAGPLPPDLIERYDGFLRDELRVPGPFRQQYRHCLIEGTVDFIFGCADALFEECEIRSVFDGRHGGFVAAPAHSLSQEKGLHFCRCRFTCTEQVAAGSIYLARPWRDYGLCVFEDCAYGPHICREGFDKWNDTNRDQTARFYEWPLLPGRVSWAKEGKEQHS